MHGLVMRSATLRRGCLKPPKMRNLPLIGCTSMPARAMSRSWQFERSRANATCCGRHLLICSSPMWSLCGFLRQLFVGSRIYHLEPLVTAATGRWRPPGLHIGEVQSIQLRPQQVAFARERSNCQLLLIARAGMLVHPIKGKLLIVGGLRQPRLKVAERITKPCIMASQGVQQYSNQAGRKYIRQR